MKNDMRIISIILCFSILTMLCGCNKVELQIGTGLLYTTIEDHAVLDYYIRNKYGKEAISESVFYDFDISNELRFVLAQRIRNGQPDCEYSLSLFNADPYKWYSYYEDPIISTETAEIINSENPNNDFEIRKLCFKSERITLYLVISNNSSDMLKSGLIRSIIFESPNHEGRGTVCTYDYNNTAGKLLVTSASYFEYYRMKFDFDSLISCVDDKSGSDHYQYDYCYDDKCNLTNVTYTNYTNKGKIEGETIYQYEYKDNHCVKMIIKGYIWDDSEYYYIRNVDGILLEVQQKNLEDESRPNRNTLIEYGENGFSRYIRAE